MTGLDKKILDDETIEMLISKNLLNRNEELCSVLKILQDKNVFNIIGLCGEWGSGKTIFCKQLNYLINNDKKQQILLSGNFTNLMRSIYINAWEFDQNIDPILSLVSAITKQIAGLSPSKEIKGFIQAIINSIVKKVSSGIVSLENIKFEDFLEIVKDTDVLKKHIQNYLNEIIDENCNRLLIVIDELDRCNAKYIITFLERLNCYFNDYRVTFLISMNEKEIIHSLDTVYGSNYNSGEYLYKIIDSKISLRKITFREYIAVLGVECYISTYWYTLIFEYLSNAFNFSLRNINRMTDYVLKHYGKEYGMSDIEVNIVDFVVIPYLFCLKLKKPLDFYDFSSKRGKNLFVDTLLGFDRIGRLLSATLKNNITGKEKEALEQIHDVINNSENDDRLQLLNISFKNDLIKYYNKKTRTF